MFVRILEQIVKILQVHRHFEVGRMTLVVMQLLLLLLLLMLVVVMRWPGRIQIRHLMVVAVIIVVIVRNTNVHIELVRTAATITQQTQLGSI